MRFFMVVLMFPVCSILPPFLVIRVPLSNRTSAVFGRHLQRPTRLIISLNQVSNVTRVISFSILRVLSRTLQLTRVFASRFRSVSVFRLVISTSIMSLSSNSTTRSRVGHLAIVLSVRPITRVRSLSVCQRQLVYRHVYSRG